MEKQRESKSVEMCADCEPHFMRRPDGKYIFVFHEPGQFDTMVVMTEQQFERLGLWFEIVTGQPVRPCWGREELTPDIVDSFFRHAFEPMTGDEESCKNMQAIGDIKYTCGKPRQHKIHKDYSASPVR